MTRHTAVLILTCTILLSACSDDDAGPTSPSIPHETTLHVAADGSGDYATIPDALAAAAEGDTILLADGEYAGSVHTPIDFGERNLVLRSASGDPAACVIAGPAPSGERALIISGNQDDQTTIEGLTFRNFHYDDFHFPNGGVAYVFKASPRFRGCNFIDNTAENGGAIYLLNASAVFENCEFRGNRATLDVGQWSNGGGGAVYAMYSASEFRSCDFRGNACTGGHINSGAGGGAVRLDDNNSVFLACDFLDNTSFNDGGAVRSSRSAQDFTACVFHRNHTDGTAGALAFNGQALFMAHCDFDSNTAGDVGALGAWAEQEALIERCRFRGNRADHLSGALAADGPVRILGCEFLRNAGTEGGAIGLTGGTGQEIIGGLFVGNAALGSGGAIIIREGAQVRVEHCTFSGNRSDWRGGSLACGPATVDLVSCTIDGDGAPQGAAIFVDSYYSTRFMLERCIITGTEGSSAIATTVALVEVSCSNLWNNAGGDFVGGIEMFADQAGNLSADPLFLAPELLDFSLQAGSPCLDESSACGGMGAWPGGG